MTAEFPAFARFDSDLQTQVVQPTASARPINRIRVKRPRIRCDPGDTPGAPVRRPAPEVVLREQLLERRNERCALLVGRLGGDVQIHVAAS